MKNIFKICTFSSFLFYSVFSYADSTAQLSGLWEETVISDDYDDTEEKDLFYISNFQDNLLIDAVNYPDYAIGQVNYDGKKLKFTMVNLVDADETYIMKYECRESIRGKEMKCNFTNQKGEVESNIVWKIQDSKRIVKPKATEH